MKILSECVDYLRKSIFQERRSVFDDPYLRRILQEEAEDASSYSFSFM